MGKKASDIISRERTYIGIKESPPFSNNVIFNTIFYGKPVSGSSYPWCMVMHWCAFKDENASDLLYGGKPIASCTELMNYAKRHNQWVTSGYKPGDIVLYNFDKDVTDSEHTGLVISVNKDGSVNTIEGNTGTSNDADGGSVMERTRSAKLVLGAYRPAYEPETEDEFKMIIDEIVKKSGKTKEEIIDILSILVASMNTVSDKHEVEGIQYLEANGFIQGTHDPKEVLNIGVFGKMMKNRKL